MSRFGLRGYFSLWTEVKRQGSDEKVFFPLTGAAIDRMMERIRWLERRMDEQGLLIWQRTQRKPWKEICAQVGCDRTTAWRRWQVAGCRLQVAGGRWQVAGGRWHSV